MRGHIIIFQHEFFRGHHRHIINQEWDLGSTWDNSLNDKVSSLVILSGEWEFFKDKKGGSGYKVKLGPGIYPRVKDVGLEDNKISSLKLVKDEW
jgi:hypothetical protein